MALVALMVQCLLVQPHVDALASAQIAARALDEQTSVSAQPKPIDPPATCYFCRELAVAGAALLATPPTLSFFERVIIDAPSAPRLAAAPLFPAHAYLSRAPPALL